MNINRLNHFFNQKTKNILELETEKYINNFFLNHFSFRE